MLPKAQRQRPVIGRLSELLVSRCRPAFLDVGSTSPTSHFDLSLMLSPSPKGNLKNYSTGGVGLAIVAALDDSAGEILVKHAVCSPRSNSGRSTPIPVALGKNCDSFSQDADENYTHVTTRGPHEISTRVYYDGGESDPSGPVLRSRSDGVSPRKSPPMVHQPSSFLRSCYLCAKNLEDLDIYMYRENAFCSPECRSKQMRRDEMKERCRSEASRSAEISNSPYNRGQIFSTGILAI